MTPVQREREACANLAMGRAALIEMAFIQGLMKGKPTKSRELDAVRLAMIDLADDIRDRSSTKKRAKA